jgi:hypothetical protein
MEHFCKPSARSAHSLAGGDSFAARPARDPPASRLSPASTAKGQQRSRLGHRNSDGSADHPVVTSFTPRFGTLCSGPFSKPSSLSGTIVENELKSATSRARVKSAEPKRRATDGLSPRRPRKAERVFVAHWLLNCRAVANYLSTSSHDRRPSGNAPTRTGACGDGRESLSGASDRHGAARPIGRRAAATKAATARLPASSAHPPARQIRQSPSRSQRKKSYLSPVEFER